ncbi:hypothetical protein OJ997_03320 [Solirubrobacter phytolaccae]|uniref:Uncharacterized protein n=1 Tax=Solirubrobacter phytolaccae TaxID=1404360 RepID=A0A9X3S7L9_9ACTN|nr:hypothetical protein [Solirubrobacter phytolaccae]MDA0179316.1 hypothetical protein [Solirubrobacter phytolaccae]
MPSTASVSFDRTITSEAKQAPLWCFNDARTHDAKAIRQLAPVSIGVKRGFVASLTIAT